MQEGTKIMAVLSLALVMLLGSPELILAGEENVLLKIGEDIVIGEGVEVSKVVAIGGDITVSGRVSADVVALGGDITVSGEVESNVVAIGGNLILKSSARIAKDAVCIGGKLRKEEGAQVAGDEVNINPFKFPCLRKAALCPLGIGGLGGLLGLLGWFKIFSLVTKFLAELVLSVLLVAFLPRPLSVIRDSLKKSWWKTLLLGILVLVCAFPLMALVGITIVGLPLIPVIAVVLAVAGLLGRVSIFFLIGEKLGRAFNPKFSSSMLAVIMGVIALNLVELVPVLGPIIYALVLTFGLGAAFITRFGTRETLLAGRK